MCVSAVQILDEYEGVKKFKLDLSEKAGDGQSEVAGKQGEGVLAKSTTGKLLEEIETSANKPQRHLTLLHIHLFNCPLLNCEQASEWGLRIQRKEALGGCRKQDGRSLVIAKLPTSKEVMKIATTDSKELPSAQSARKLASKWPKPKWHPPWHCYRVISGHLGLPPLFPTSHSLYGHMYHRILPQE